MVEQLFIRDASDIRKVNCVRQKKFIQFTVKLVYFRGCHVFTAADKVNVRPGLVVPLGARTINKNLFDFRVRPENGLNVLNSVFG